jgi:hypothetical protein
MFALFMILFSVEKAKAQTDVLPPNAPTGLFVAQGNAWQADSSFDLWWDNPPGQESPIAVAHYEICPAAPLGPCTVNHVAGLDISELTVDLPFPGFFWLRLWLEDEVGNVNPNSKSPAVALRFDNEAPPVPSILNTDNWVNHIEVSGLELLVDIDFIHTVPLSTIEGYSVTFDDTEPDDVIDMPAEQDGYRYPSHYSVSDPPQGVIPVRVRSVSHAGFASDQSAVGTLRVDLMAPGVAVQGLLPSDEWSNEPVVVKLEASDQAHLSGMGAAPDDRPIEEGGYVRYELDEVESSVRGGEALIEVAEDGVHSLSYQAFDAAGNPSDEDAVSFKVDGTAPAGAFHLSDPSDPRQLTVGVSDAASGVANGHIEYRAEGVSSFTRLPTKLKDGRLQARLDDLALRQGRYVFRAIVTDVAGNQAVIDQRVGGASMALTLPIRSFSQVHVSASETVTTCSKLTRKRATKGRRKHARKPKRARCRTRAVTRVAPSALTVGHGKGSRSVGRVTRADGAPVAGATVIVDGQHRSDGPFVRLGSVKADGQGTFRFQIPAGPSSTIRYRYDGSNTVRPSLAQLMTKVPSAARLRVNRKRVRNGQAVTFTGRLLGMPIPAAGKLVALQARVGGRWRTFATPRANSKGVFRYRYRFTSTTGRRRYVFRAVVAREAAYPYERGITKTVKVVVHGR